MGLPYVIQIQCECRELSKAFARNVIVTFARIESFWAFNLGFNSSMKRISKIKKSNLDGHFVKTGKSMKHFFRFLITAWTGLLEILFSFTSMFFQRMLVFTWSLFTRVSCCNSLIWSPGGPCKGVQIRQSLKDPTPSKHLYLELSQYSMDGIVL